MSLGHSLKVMSFHAAILSEEKEETRTQSLAHKPISHLQSKVWGNPPCIHVSHNIRVYFEHATRLYATLPSPKGLDLNS